MTVVVLYLKHVAVRRKAALQPKHFPNHTVYRRVKTARKVNILMFSYIMGRSCRIKNSSSYFVTDIPPVKVN